MVAFLAAGLHGRGWDPTAASLGRGQTVRLRELPNGCKEACAIGAAMQLARGVLDELDRPEKERAASRTQYTNRVLGSPPLGENL